MTSRLEISVSKHVRVVGSTSSKGDQIKWFKDDYWIKANTFGYEDIAEYFTSELLGMSDIKTPYVKYGICKINENNKKFNGCYSMNFLYGGEFLITFARLFDKYLIDYNKILGDSSIRNRIFNTINEIYRITELDVTDYIRDTLTLDAIILNEDRHMNNLAVIYNSYNNKYRLCPIFDNGLSILSDTSDYDYHTSVSIHRRNVKARPFHVKFNKQAEILGAGFKINRCLLDNYLMVNNKELGRVKQVIESSMKIYSSLFI